MIVAVYSDLAMRGVEILNGHTNPRRYEFTEMLGTLTVSPSKLSNRVFLFPGICIVVMRSAWDGETASSILAFPIMALWLQTQAVHLSDGIAVGCV